jgi:hypothetical protein
MQLPFHPVVVLPSESLPVKKRKEKQGGKKRFSGISINYRKRKSIMLK